MSEIIRVCGIDAGLRNCGLAIVQYNTETSKFQVFGCQTLKCPPQYKEESAILHMIEELVDAAYNGGYLYCSHTVIESPAVIFNSMIPRGTMIKVAHIAGACAAVFNGACSLVKPSKWTKGRQKEKSAYWTQKILGDTSEWEYIGTKKRGKKIDEHQIDAAGLALWFIRENFIE